MSRWTRTTIETACFAVKNEVTVMLQTRTSHEVLDVCLEKLDSEAPAGQEPEHDAWRLYYAIACIVLVSSRPSQAEQLVPKLEKLVKGMLTLYNIKPRKSALSQMYQHLSIAKAYYFAQKGELGRAILESSLGFSMSKNALKTELPLVGVVHAQIVLQNGFATEAAKIFSDLRHDQDWSMESQLSFLGELRSLRLSGQHQAACRLLDSLGNREFSKELELELNWDKILLQTSQKFSQALEDCAGQDKGLHTLNKLWLLARIIPLKDFGIRSQHLRQILNRTHWKELKFRYGTELIEEFETLLNTSIPFEHRLPQALEMSTLLGKVDIETRLIGLAALSRWYERNDQKHMAFVMGEEYRSLSLRLSQGKDNNLLLAYGYTGTRDDASTAAVEEWLDRRAADS